MADTTTDMQNKLQAIQETSDIEFAQIESYRKIYVSTNGSEPAQPIFQPFDPQKYSFIQEKGMDALAFILSAIGGAVFAAIRTAGIFTGLEKQLLEKYGMSAGTINVLAFIAGLAILLGVEGYLVGFGYHKGRSSGKINTSYQGVLIAGSISAIAGIISSFGLLADGGTKSWLSNFVGWVLVFLSGPGMAYLIYLGTENIGVLHNAWNNFIKEREAEWDTKHNLIFTEWEDKLRKWREDFEADYRRKGREILFDAGTYTVKKSNVLVSKDSNDKLRPKVHAFLKEREILPSQVGDKKNGALISPADIANDLGLVGKERDAVRTYMAQYRSDEKLGKW